MANGGQRKVASLRPPFSTPLQSLGEPDPETPFLVPIEHAPPLFVRIREDKISLKIYPAPLSYCLWAGTPWCRSLRRLTKILCILRLRCRPCGRCCWNPTTNKRGLLSVRCFPSLHPARFRCVQSCVERIPGGQIQAKSRLFHFPLSPNSKLWGCSPPGVRCTSYNRNQSWLLQWSSLGISQHLWAWQTPV